MKIEQVIKGNRICICIALGFTEIHKKDIHYSHLFCQPQRCKNKKAMLSTIYVRFPAFFFQTRNVSRITFLGITLL